MTRRRRPRSPASAPILPHHLPLRLQEPKPRGTLRCVRPAPLQPRPQRTPHPPPPAPTSKTSSSPPPPPPPLFSSLLNVAGPINAHRAATTGTTMVVVLPWLSTEERRNEASSWLAGPHDEQKDRGH
ncbi:Os08g0122850 [Oryza sativa Japonica Group]|uniref:Os08g0122850 protein n=1 Tax=Oryza sativa subsp. japonica TaxID=39947 RepID=A0A0P0XB98_ORYSJ|nr:Os08g0122850 [Oryza sativa Japonica Group]